MHPSRPVVLSGVAFAAVSMLLPFASFPIIGSVDGLSADAWPTLIPLIPVAILTMFGRWDLSYPPGVGILAVALSSVGLAFAVTKVGDAIVAVRSAAGATLGPGSWILAIASAVATAGAAYGVLSRS
jgi:hypothetical protein